MNVALCKCGIDMSEHEDLWSDRGREWTEDDELKLNGHYFDAAGTKHRCEELIEFATLSSSGEIVRTTWMCPRPAYHKEKGVECGPLTGKKLW